MSSQDDNQERSTGDASSIWASMIDDVRDAYVLGSLDDRDRKTFLMVLERFPETAEEIASEANALSLIGLAAEDAGTPSASARRALFERIEAGRRDSPVIAPTNPWTSSTPVAANGEAPTPAREDGAGSRSWTRFIPPALTAPLMIAVVVLVAWSTSLQNQLDRAEGELDPGLFTADGPVQLYSMEPMCTGCEGNGRVGIDMADSVGMVLAWNLDPADEQEVWCTKSNGDKERVTQLDVNDDGGAMLMFDLPSENEQYTQVYLQDKDGTVTYMSDMTATEEPDATPPPW